MDGLIYVLNIICVWVSLIGLIYSVGFILYSFFSKNISKKTLTRNILLCVIFVFIIYCIYYAGIYQSMKIGNETIDRLLSISIEEIDVSDFEEKDYPNICSYVKNECQFEGLMSEPYIEICRSKFSKNNEEEYYSKDLKFKMYGKAVSGTKSTLIIYPRESDRDFYDIYLFSKYGYYNKICVVNEKYSLTISYLSRENNDILLNRILDNLLI